MFVHFYDLYFLQALENQLLFVVKPFSLGINYTPEKSGLD
jgi:hypothetical protein